MKWSGFDDAAIDRFARFQRMSFDIQQGVAANLVEGATEKSVAKELWSAYRDAGVASYFHLPVVLFGDRTTLPDPWEIGEFWPTDRRLGSGDSVILDASPIFDGVLVDTSTTRCFDPVDGADFASAAADDLGYRETVLAAVQAQATFQEIAIEVDKQFTASGYRNCHQLHPGEVLGHRVGDVSDASEPDQMGFASDLVDWFYAQLAAGADGNLNKPAPTWSANDNSGHRPADGLWAVEPHLGIGPIGVKWEEILVIQGSEAYWLQDDPPHVTDW